MIYLETILDDHDTFRLERQKDTPTGEWYAVALVKGKSYPQGNVSTIAENEDYIQDLSPRLKVHPQSTMEEINLPYDKAHVKILRKILKKATKLGWFSDINTASESYPPEGL